MSAPREEEKLITHSPSYSLRLHCCRQVAEQMSTFLWSPVKDIQPASPKISSSQNTQNKSNKLTNQAKKYKQEEIIPGYISHLILIC